MPARRGIALFVAAASIALVFCTPEAAPLPAKEPVAIIDASAPVAREDAAPSIARVIDAGHDAQADVFSAWSDPGATDALAADCNATGEPVTDELRRPERSPLACRLPFDQSCVYDPCFDKTQTCRGGCSQTCGSCDDACKTTCTSCKAACKGDGACIRSCAQTTGQCKQACITKLDTCSTADCAKAAAACYIEEKQTWRAHHCSCKRISPCTDACINAKGDCGSKCTEKSPPDCWDKCDKNGDGCLGRCRKTYPGCDLTYCMMGGMPSWDYPQSP